MKTVRFSQVVERSGRPHVHSLWVAPENDAELKAAQKSHRVMTVSPPERGKADVGTVGFDGRHPAKGQILIFPKSLAKFANARVVGVKFDLVDQPPTRGARIAETLAGTGRRPKPHPKRSDRRASEPTARATDPGKRTQPASSDHRRPDQSGRQAAAGGHHPSPGITPGPFKRGAAHPPSQARRTKAPKSDGGTAVLKQAMRAALKELRQGKTVAAYQRLEDALR